MTAMQVAQHMTADEFIAAPEPGYGRPWNLINGDVVVNDPAPLHAHAQIAIVRALLRWLDGPRGSGTLLPGLDVKLDERNVFVPDTMWYSADRAPSRGAKPPSPMPDLAVEVRSPSTWRYDVGAKRDGYEAHGLPELWLVDTESETILVYRRSKPSSPKFDVALELGAGETLTSPQLPGFELPIEAVFADR